MHQRHFRAPRDVEAGGERGGGQHGEDGHAVHVVCDRFTVGDAEAAPAFARGGFEAGEEVEEGEWCCWGGSGCGWRRKGGEDCEGLLGGSKFLRGLGRRRGGGRVPD